MKIQKIYKKDGTLLKTKKIGPQVINKETLTAADSPDKSKIKSTLDKELARDIVIDGKELAKDYKVIHQTILICLLQ